MRLNQTLVAGAVLVLLSPAQTTLFGDDHGAPHAPTAPSVAPSKPKAEAPAATAPSNEAKPAESKAAATPKENAGTAGPATKLEDAEHPDATAALTFLKEGNARWVSDACQNPSQDSARRQSTAEKGQTPFALVVTCADSRLPVERIFDRGVGEIFAVRVAGNIGGDSEAASVDYGVGHLHIPLLVVMGHTRCGAVSAAVKGGELHGKVAGLVAHIKPAVDRARTNNPALAEAALIDAAVRENVWQTIFDLYRASPDIREAAAGGHLKVVGAVCDIATGKVEFMGEHPWQSQLFAALKGDSSDEHAPAHAEAPTDAHP